MLQVCIGLEIESEDDDAGLQNLKVDSSHAIFIRDNDDLIICISESLQFLFDEVVMANVKVGEDSDQVFVVGQCALEIVSIVMKGVINDNDTFTLLHLLIDKDADSGLFIAQILVRVNICRISVYIFNLQFRFLFDWLHI